MTNTIIDQTVNSSQAHQVKEILYEQPLNESIKLLLRLEQLSLIVDKNLHQPTEFHSHIAITHFIKILQLIERSDLKSKITQMLMQQATTLDQLKQFPDVDVEKLNTIIKKLDFHIQSLHHLKIKICQPLLENTFLQQLKQQLHQPGGLCQHSLPALNLWINQPATQRQYQLSQWFDQFQSLNNITQLLLSLIRNSSNFHVVPAKQGFYQQSLNANSPCNLLQLKLPKHLTVHPEFGFGRHLLTIRFLDPQQFNERPVQIKKDFSFQINLCRS